MSEKSIILQKLHEFNQEYSDALPYGPTEEVLEQMESLLMDYLKKYPKDTEMWLKLTMVEFTPPWEDYERIEKYITSILKYDENNVQGLLILAYAQYVFRGEVTKDLFIRLQVVSNITTDKEWLSMIYLAIAWYYWGYDLKDEKKYEESLLQSINYCSEYVDNYELLGRLYLEIDREIEGKKMIRCALANVQKIYGENYDSFDITDINEFFNEFYKSTHITRPNLESIQELLD